MKIRFLGALSEVGRSCIEIQVKKTKILVDAGIKLGKTITLPEFNLKKAKEIKAILLSHAHLDHSGFIPVLIKNGFKGKIYCTKPTRDLMELLLSDAAKIAKEEKKDLFEIKDLKETMKKVKVIDFNRKFRVTKEIKAKYFKAGHIIGSASILIEAENKRMLYSGDLNDRKTKLLGKEQVKAKEMDLLVLESTYGGKKDLIPNEKNSGKELARIINQTIKEKGKILIPVFAVGRAQEIMLLLEDYISSGFIKKTPVYLDGMLRKATRITRNNVLFLRKEIPRRILLNGNDPFNNQMFKVSRTKTKKDVMKEETAIILASSGMLSGGASIEYFKRMAEDKKNTIIFAGYQAKNTLGRKLIEGKKEIKIGEKTIKVKARIEKLKFSGHADFNGLLRFIRKTKPRKIALIHGEKEKIKELKKEIQKKEKITVLVPKIKKEIVI